MLVLFKEYANKYASKTEIAVDIAVIVNELPKASLKEFDDIMVQIKKASEDSRVDAIEGEIRDNTIIPGISGSEIDIDKSYSKMKRYGKYNEKLLEYKSIKPNTNLSVNINKYIQNGWCTFRW